MAQEGKDQTPTSPDTGVDTSDEESNRTGKSKTPAGVVTSEGVAGSAAAPNPDAAPERLPES